MIIFRHFAALALGHLLRVIGAFAARHFAALSLVIGHLLRVISLRCNWVIDVKNN